MKYILILITAFSLMLSGYTTMMTPQQHQIFAKDWVMLDLCTKTGLISPELSAQARQLYRFRLQNYKFEEDAINTHINNYDQQIRRNLNDAACNTYAAQVYEEILDRQQMQASIAELSQTLQGLSNSFANSTYQQMQINQQMNQTLMSTPQYQPQPIIPPKTTTNCMRVGNGMYNCQSQTR